MVHWSPFSGLHLHARNLPCSEEVYPHGCQDRARAMCPRLVRSSLWRLAERWREEPQLGVHVCDATIFGHHAISLPATGKKVVSFLSHLRQNGCESCGSEGRSTIFTSRAFPWCRLRPDPTCFEKSITPA